MIASNQNSIHSAVLNFEYENKTAAIRNNVLIESIFYSHILSALENTISRTVPNGVHVELSKLEIDIGTIGEKEMSSELSLRIASTLAEALYDILKITENLANGSPRFTNSGKDDILINALEFYFDNGYFPLWVDPVNTVEGLMGQMLSENKDELIQLLLKIGGHERTIRRIVYGVSDKLFDKLLRALQPADTKWMIEFVKTLLDIKKESGYAAVNNKEFSKTLHFFILQYLLDNKSLILHKTKFSDSILKEVLGMLNIEAPLFLKTINARKGQYHLKKVLNESLAKLQDKSRVIGEDRAEQELSIGQLLVRLNADGNLDVQDTFFNKQLLKVLRDREESTILYNGLNETGIIQVLRLAYAKRANELLKTIRSFSTIEVAGKKALTVKELAKATLRYLNESAIRVLNNEEYILFLFQISGFATDQTIQSDRVKSFIQKRRNLSLKKLQNIIEIERDNPEISNICAVLSKNGDKCLGTISGRTAEINQTREYFAIYSQKIVWHYLTLGDLPKPNSDLTRKDVQRLFRSLLEKQDDFLMRRLSTHPNKQKLIDRLEVLFALNVSYKALNMPLPEILLPENKKTNSFLTQLYAFSPGILSDKVNSEFWKRVVGRFAILTCIENEKYDLTSFALAFINDVKQHLKSVNDLELFGKIIDRMKFSKVRELKGIVEIWEVSNIKQIPPKDTALALQDNPSKKEDIVHFRAKRLFYYVSILRFCAHRGFFPWWTDKMNFTDVLEELKRIKQSEPRQFMATFDQFEKEEPFLELLLRQWPKPFVNELEHLIPNQIPLSTVPRSKLAEPGLKERFNVKHLASKNWNEKYDNQITVDKLFANEFKNTENSFQTLYHIEDDKILGVWGKDNSQMAKQIGEYVILAPYFYFRSLSPIRWRKMVYEFSHAFYVQGHRKPMLEFHRELLKHLVQKYSHIDWKDVLTSVYQMTQSAEGSMPKAFPEEMAGLIKDVSLKHKKSDAKNQQGNDQIDYANDNRGTKVANAGLILFWPFLTRFFEQLSIIKNGNFVSGEDQNTAVYLLQYLAFNAVDFPEHQLVINKVLVGMPPQEPLFPFPQLSDDAKNMAQSLINGLIANWEKVKDSTPEGIQETFIQREGLLTFKTDSIVLKVDKKGVDVLLDFIPWNISLVKLPWMRLPLYVEWI